MARQSLHVSGSPSEKPTRWWLFIAGYHVSDRSQAESRPFEHRVLICPTSFQLPEHLEGLVIQQNISELYALLATNDRRNQMIVADVVKAVQDKRSPVVLTERREHLEVLEKMLSPLMKNVIVMTGGMGKKRGLPCSCVGKDVRETQGRV